MSKSYPKVTLFRVILLIMLGVLVVSAFMTPSIKAAQQEIQTTR